MSIGYIYSKRCKPGWHLWKRQPEDTERSRFAENPEFSYELDEALERADLHFEGKGAETGGCFP